MSHGGNVQKGPIRATSSVAPGDSLLLTKLQSTSIQRRVMGLLMLGDRLGLATL